MAQGEFVLRSRRVVLPDGVRPASIAIAIAAGRIVRVGKWDDLAGGVPVEDCGDLVILPGIVDTHVHVNDPGRAEWEGFESATRAAAAGGVTTLVDMPLNSIPATTTAGALETKRVAARGRIAVDVGFWGGVVPGNIDHLAPMHGAGVLGFKAFLAPSGVDEFPAIDREQLLAAAGEIARLDSVLLVHAEDPAKLGSGGGLSASERRSHLAWERSRPPSAEAEAIRWLVAAARESGARIHVVHLSSGAGVELVRAARSEGVRLSAETCPHYLTFDSAAIADGGTAWKCAPPIRGGEAREQLWGGLADGTLELVASDHSPSPPAGKLVESGDFFGAWGGIASLQLALAATWTEARARGFGLDRLGEWMAAAPARLAGLAARKGSIAVGRDADLVLFDPEASFPVEPASLYHRHPMTPYSGRILTGRVLRTYLRGQPVWSEGQFAAPSGELLAR